MTTKTAEIPLEMVSLDQLKPSKTNPRKRFDEHALNELAESIKKQGIVQPILVRANGSGYEIVAGERRFRAAKIAGLVDVPVIVRELKDQDVLEIQVIENLQRMDLHPLEEAEGYRQLMRLPKPHCYDAAKIAEHVGRSVKYVYDRIKLLDLIEPLQKDFRDDKITAGHAILLARLSSADQKLAAAKNTGGLWQHEHASFDFGDGHGKGTGYKLCSVRELQDWINDHCRFVAQRDADPMLFPETAALIKSLDPKKKSDKIVSLATGYVQDSARNGEKHISPASWKRADGKHGTKTCDLSVVGVIIAGEERAQAFRVCIAKDKCKVHWADRIKARAKRNGMEGVKTDGMSQAQIQRKEKEAREAEVKRQEEVALRWKLALPKILEQLAAAVKKAPTGSTSCLGEIVQDLIVEHCYTGNRKKALELIPLGETADDLVRHIAFWSLVDMGEHHWEREAFIKHAKFFGVDAMKIVDQVAPVQTSAKAETKPATKAKK